MLRCVDFACCASPVIRRYKAYMTLNTEKRTTSNLKIGRFFLLIFFLSIAQQIVATEYLGSPASIAGPRGLTVIRNSATNNIVSWHAVAGATSYTLQHRLLYPANLWTNVPGCDPTSTACTDITGTTSAYAYRVQAFNGTKTTDWSNVAVFLSEPDNDGYVIGPPFSTDSAVSDSVQPGILAGQGIPGTVDTSIDLKGFLSFHTSSLGSNTTVLSAKLRLKQSTSNDAFDLLGPCIVDIQKGAFSGNAALQAGDDFYTDANTSLDAFEITGVGPEQWFQAIVGTGDQVSNTDYTQFRIYFNHAQGVTNTWAGWYSGESTNNEPQLIVRYKE